LQGKVKPVEMVEFSPDIFLYIFFHFKNLSMVIVTILTLFMGIEIVTVTIFIGIWIMMKWYYSGIYFLFYK